MEGMTLDTKNSSFGWWVTLTDQNGKVHRQTGPHPRDRAKSIYRRWNYERYHDNQ